MGELLHILKSVNGADIPQVSTSHYVDGQTAGDFIYFDGSIWTRTAAPAMVNGTISTFVIYSSTISTSNITGSTITTSTIEAGSMTSTSIIKGTISTAKIYAGSISSATITVATISGSAIKESTISGTGIVGGTISTSTIYSADISTGSIGGVVNIAGLPSGDPVATGQWYLATTTHILMMSVT